MKLSLVCACATTCIGMLVAVSYFPYVLVAIKFYYYIVPILFVVILTTPKRLQFTQEHHSENISHKLSRTKYFVLLLSIQVVFYFTMFWLFNCYLYQAKINCHLHTIDVLAMAMLLKQDPLLYTVLPFIAVASLGLGLLYFVVQHKKKPTLTECFYREPKKLPRLFFYNIMINAEKVAYLISLYIIFIFFLLNISNAMSLLLLNFAPLSNPLAYTLLLLPSVIIFKKYDRVLVGWFVRHKYSFGFMFVIIALGCLLILAMLNVLFIKPLVALTNAVVIKHAMLQAPVEILLPKRFEMLLLGWFFINLPRLVSMVGRFSYGFTMREAAVLNLLAIVVISAGLNLFVIDAWATSYELLTAPFWLFYSSLFVLLVLWLHGCYIKDRASLNMGPMAIFCGPAFKRRSIMVAAKTNIFVALIMVSSAGVMGWRLSQYFSTFIVIFLWPVCLCFSLVLLQSLVWQRLKDVQFGRYSSAPLSS